MVALFGCTLAFVCADMVVFWFRIKPTAQLRVTICPINVYICKPQSDCSYCPFLADDSVIVSSLFVVAPIMCEGHGS